MLLYRAPREDDRSAAWYMYFSSIHYISLLVHSTLLSISTSTTIYSPQLSIALIHQIPFSSSLHHHITHKTGRLLYRLTVLPSLMTVSLLNSTHMYNILPAAPRSLLSTLPHRLKHSLDSWLGVLSIFRKPTLNFSTDSPNINSSCLIPNWTKQTNLTNSSAEQHTHRGNTPIQLLLTQHSNWSGQSACTFSVLQYTIRKVQSTLLTAFLHHLIGLTLHLLPLAQLVLRFQQVFLPHLWALGLPIITLLHLRDHGRRRGGKCTSEQADTEKKSYYSYKSFSIHKPLHV